ncbi:hypothetical protein DsansV1_C32g0223601 [Dioscorea sansibarensis]
MWFGCQKRFIIYEVKLFLMAMEFWMKSITMLLTRESWLVSLTLIF